MTASVTVDRERLRRTTAPHLLCERARTMPDSVAFRSKHFGIYRERTLARLCRAGGACRARLAERSASSAASASPSWATSAKNG